MKPTLINERENLQLEAKRLEKKVWENINTSVNSYTMKGKKVMWIGGAILVAYGIAHVVTLFIISRRRHDVTKEGQVVVVQQPEEESSILRAFKQYIAAFLIELAKQELMRLLEAYRETKANKKPQNKD